MERSAYRGEPGRLLSDDPHRPLYHFLPPANWLNDPNGLIYWQGLYHLFYQYNPEGAFHDKISWGHAASPDLVHWTHMTIALAPTPGSPDEDSCWSGCAVAHKDAVTFIYTGRRGAEELPCVATGIGDLSNLEKYPHNPVIAQPPEGLSLVGFRDHSVWKENRLWYQLIGAGIEGAGGTALLYRSADLLHWEYIHPLFTADAAVFPELANATMWECPDFFSIDAHGDRYCLLVSVVDDVHGSYPAYFTGSYSLDSHRFTPEQFRKLDYGASFYAPQTLLDSEGRRIMWGWLREERSDAAQREAGWSGVMSLPRLLSPHPAGTLLMRPAPELEILRGSHVSLPRAVIEGLSPVTLGGISGDALEIKAVFELCEAEEVGLAVRCAPDGSEQTRISYRRQDRALLVDTSRSSMDPEAYRGVRMGELELARGEALTLRVFLDRSVVEVFANERACLASRIYPTRTDSLGISVYAQGGKATLQTLEIWEMGSIWPDRPPALQYGS